MVLNRERVIWRYENSYHLTSTSLLCITKHLCEGSKILMAIQKVLMFEYQA